VFSEWDRIFKDPMTTAAAIDRLVHHSVIVEMTGGSIRIEDAQSDRAKQGGTPTDPNTSTLDLTSIPGAAPTALRPTTPTTTTATTTTPTTTTERTSTTTTPIATTTPPTDNPIPGAAPTAPSPATSTDHPHNQGGPTNDRRQKIKNRVLRRTEADDEM
jgi:hypothetical protein